MKLWMRLGVTLDITADEAEALLGDEESEKDKVLKKIVGEDRFLLDGESYIPQCCIAQFNETYGIGYREDSDVDIECR